MSRKFVVVILVTGVLLSSFFIGSSFFAPPKEEAGKVEPVTPQTSPQPGVNSVHNAALPGVDALIPSGSQSPQAEPTSKTELTPNSIASNQNNLTAPANPANAGKSQQVTKSSSEAAVKTAPLIVSSIIPGLVVPDNSNPVATPEPTIAPTAGVDAVDATSTVTPGATPGPKPTNLLPDSSNINITAAVPESPTATITQGFPTTTPNPVPQTVTITPVLPTPTVATTPAPSPTVMTGSWQTSARIVPAVLLVPTITRIEGTFGVALTGNYQLDMELFNSSGDKIDQFSSNWLVRVGVPQVIVWNWSNWSDKSTGVLTLKMGIFNSAGQSQIWNDNALSFSSNNIPTTSPTPSPTTIPITPPITPVTPTPTVVPTVSPTPSTEAPTTVAGPTSTPLPPTSTPTLEPTSTIPPPTATATPSPVPPTPTVAATVTPSPTVTTGSWQTSARIVPAINQVSTITRIEGTFEAAVAGTYMLDMEIFNSTGTRVGQNEETWQLNIGSSQVVVWNWSNWNASGVLTVKMGIFNTAGQPQTWNDNALSFSVAGSGTPTPTATPTPTPVITAPPVTPTPTATATPAPTVMPTPSPTPTVSPTVGANQPAVSGLIANSNSVPTYDKFELSFNIPNTTATNWQFPYDPNPPAGVPAAQGITVDGIFSSDNWASSVTQPAFVYQNFDRTIVNNGEHIYPTGNKLWKIRFAPTKPGAYRYKIRIVDASGTRFFPASGDLSFAATNATPGDHGFIKVSSTDSRYMEFSDGTPFIGIGTNSGYDSPRDKVTSLTGYITRLSQSGGNFLRTWFSDISLYGSAWSPWNSPTQPYDGYIPANGMSYDDAYNGNQFSMKLDTTNPCLFQGWFDNTAVKPSTSYQISVRAKLVGITGSNSKYGFAVKTGGWLTTSCSNSDNGTYLLPRVTSSSGPNGWQVFTASFTSSSGQYYLNDLYLALENATGGTVFIDEVSIKENLGNGQFGPEIVNKGKAAQQLYYSDAAADRLDDIVAEAERSGVYLKPVVLEKNDFVFGHINADGSILRNGITQGDNNNFYAQPNTEVRRLQEYYWRYLTARWGYSTAIQSWELLNEGDPYNGNHYAQAEAFAKFFQVNDPNRHMATTSFWHSLPISQFWSNASYPDMAYADAHAYSGQTSWLTFNNNNIDPITGVNISNDSAVFSFAHSMSAKALFTGFKVKPVIMGEVGLINNGVQFGNNDSDTTGVWLHQWLWGQVNSGDVQYSLYWWNNSIKKYNLYSIFSSYSNFMQGTSGDAVNKRLPVNNGKYTDIGLRVPGNVFGWGQKDTTNGGAYFWMYDKNYTFTNPTGGANVSGASVAFDGMPAKTYTIEWWDTWSGKVISETRVHGGGTLTLTVPAGIAQKDVAVKIFPTGGF